MTDSSKPTPKPGSDEESLGELVKRASEQTADLVRSEIRLAQLEIQHKAKRAGIGVALFGGAGVVALLGVAVMALTGKKQVEQATPPAPEEAIASVQEDVHEVKTRSRHP